MLGYLWSMLNPALVLAIYYMVFKVIARNTIPSFAIFLFCGLLVWNLFNNSANAATSVVVANSGIVKKVAFPRELLALSTVGVAFILFAIQVVVLILALAAFGIVPSFAYLYTLPSRCWPCWSSPVRSPSSSPRSTSTSGTPSTSPRCC